MENKTEQRRYRRVALRLNASLTRKGSDRSAEGQIQNISIDGFQCLTHSRFQPGELLDCTIAIGDQCLGDPSSLGLRCTVVVVRVASGNEWGTPFSLACHIREYHVIGRPRDNEDINPVPHLWMFDKFGSTARRLVKD